MSRMRCASRLNLRRSRPSRFRILNVSTGSFMFNTSVDIDAPATKVLHPSTPMESGE